jgi:pimeloyl-ACP methyl ester carboxylesterase
MKNFKKNTFTILVLLLANIIAASQSVIFPEYTANTTHLNEIELVRDDIVLKGKFFSADGLGPFVTLILLPGFPGNTTDVLGLGKMLSQKKVNVLTFNYGGTHHSQGEWGFENSQKDIDAAYRFLAQQENIQRFKIDPARIYLGGWSYGGGMALAYASRHPEITSVFSIAGNDHCEFLRQYNLNSEMKKIVDNMFDEVGRPGGIVRIAPGQLPKDLAKDITGNMDIAFDFKEIAPVTARKDVLLIGGWDDWNVPFDGIVFPFYKELKKEKAEKLLMVGLHDDHYFRNSRTEIAQILTEWIKSMEK